MDIGSVSSSISSAVSQASTGDTVGTLMLKKALDIQAQSAAQMLSALPQTSSINPPNLGQNVDIKA